MACPNATKQSPYTHECKKLPILTKNATSHTTMRKLMNFKVNELNNWKIILTFILVVAMAMGTLIKIKDNLIYISLPIAIATTKIKVKIIFK